MMNRVVNMSGRTFGRWTVTGLADHQQPKRPKAWLCKCSCGQIKSINGNSLRRGLSTSCGCLQREITIARNYKHGHGHGSPEYNSWKHMVRRCADPRNNRYANYGGRGIKVCDRWSDFLTFLADMGPKPVPSFTIDRVDNDKDYCPENCRWSDSLTQARNKTNSVVLECDGDRRTMAEWAEVSGLNIQTLWARINRGWSAKKAIFFPVRLNKVLRFSK